MFPDAPIILGVIAFLWGMVIYIIVTRGWRVFGPSRTTEAEPITPS